MCLGRRLQKGNMDTLVNFIITRLSTYYIKKLLVIKDILILKMTTQLGTKVTKLLRSDFPNWHPIFKSLFGYLTFELLKQSWRRDFERLSLCFFDDDV